MIMNVSAARIRVAGASKRLHPPDRGAASLTPELEGPRPAAEAHGVSLGGRA